MNIVLAGFGLLGNLIKGFFGLKSAEKDLARTALETIKDVNSAEKDRAVAFAQYMAADSQSGYWLAACIRPLMALLLIILVGCWFFGYAPPNLMHPMPPFIDKAVDALMVFMGVYVPGRSLEKIVSAVMASKAIRAYMDKL